MDIDSLSVRTRAWIDEDPDPDTSAELAALLTAENFEELADRMAGNLKFGTAGLRGRVEAGSNRMNRAVVIRTTRGIAEYLGTGRGNSELVIVGRDARLSSGQLMEDTVGVLAASGHTVRYFPEAIPTPLVAYATMQLQARMAIVITASHNPPWENGYKVYDQNGAQVVFPVDRDIATAIEAVGSPLDIPLISNPYGADRERVSEVPRDVFSCYLDGIAATRWAPVHRPLKIVYTPLHGVGGRFVTSALTRFGNHMVVPVVEQFEPDGRFPTVDSPNPEELGALDLALGVAADEKADVLISNDPDVDRLAVAIPDGDGWRQLTGNQIGVLLCDYALASAAFPDPLVLSSIVSTPMFAEIADAWDARHVATLTGFKWIWSAALALEEAGEGTFLFGFEEALGYSVSRAVRDKDGISAAVAFADLVSSSLAAGKEMVAVLAELYMRHGLWVSTQHSVVRPGKEGAADIAAAVDRAALAPPRSLHGDTVTAVTDYREGAERRPLYRSAESLIEFTLESGGRVLVRPSGTEAKLKVYVDLIGRLGPGEDWRTTERILVADATRMAGELVGLLGFR